jgi:DNA repair exonuclease SbcCD ATPase subunit
LRDTKWKLQQLQVQYDNLSSKSSASGMTFRKHEEQLEDYAQRVRELKRTLEELKHEKELSDLKADRVVELEDLVRELRSSNRSLEENINRLCEAPFISEAYGQQENRHKSDELIRDRAELKSKVEHLQEAVKTNYSALVSMKEEAAALRSAKNEAEKLMEEYRSKYQELEMGASVLQDKMRLFSGDDGLNVDDLERALTVVKRRGEAVKNLEFLEEIDEGVSETKELLKRKLQSVQIINLNLSKEVERLENMLRLQSSISKDLHKEVETLVRKMEREKSDFQKKTAEIESVSARRQEKIQSLEAVIRQHVYSTAKGGKSTGFLLDSNAAMRSALAAETEPEVQNDLLVELINEKDGDIRPDENLLEVWVKACTIQDRIVLPGSSTFVVIDFFDYESQPTSLVSGSKPNWDFAATFKIIVDDFLLLYMATDSISFELNMVITHLANLNILH